ncbi:Bromodomain [Trinorchestia longiramus]|nr:Bromodomain [Trinorchestia longiramus]
MVGTRSNKEEEVSGRAYFSTRDSRKGSRGALEEPEDEIFWDSDEVKEDFASPSASTVKSSGSSSMKRIKGKGSSSKGTSSPALDQGGRRRICKPVWPLRDRLFYARSEDSSSNDCEFRVPVKAKGVSSSKVSPKTTDKKSQSKKELNKSTETLTGDSEKPVPVKTKMRKLSNGAPGDTTEGVKQTTVDQDEEGRQAGTSISAATDGCESIIKSETDIQIKREVLASQDVEKSEVSGARRSIVPEEDELSGTGKQTGVRSVKHARRRRKSWLAERRRARGLPSASSGKQDPDVRYDSEDASDDIEYSRRGRHSRQITLPRRYQEDTEEEEEISRGVGKPRGNKGKCRLSSTGKTPMSPLQTTRRRTRAVKFGSPRRSRPKRILAPQRNVGLMSYEEEEEEEEDEEEDDDDAEKSLRVVGRRRSRAETMISDEDDDLDEAPKKKKRAAVGLRRRGRVAYEEQSDSEEYTTRKTRGRGIQPLKEDIQEQEPRQNTGADGTGGISVSPRRLRGQPAASSVPACRSAAHESEEDKEEDSEDVVPTRKRRPPPPRKGKLVDPVLRNEDCLKYSMSLSVGKKRTRRPVARFSYSSNSRSKNKSSSSQSSPSSSEAEDDEDEKKYALRKRMHKQNRELREREARHRSRVPTFLGSPARKPVTFKRKTTHNKSSTSKSSSSSEDERMFEERRARGNAKARSQLLPMNFNEEDMQRGVIRERSKVGTSLADVEPMSIDRDVTFNSVGGLNHHLRLLREMVVLPLLYPEVFDKFGVTAPRGVLFYGPPGTGKTLVARALANECSIGDKKVAFFMRKGADCLSKWVGESERQLRLLFDQAYQMRPSVIFFDEIDGLAPVRSSRQDQIHSSIVSTLLALMDGLDCRGEIIVIGATNRIEAIDPALRRPGRFDRELCFPLPSLKARKHILSLHTSKWQPRPSERLLQYLAAQTSGYCGADLKSLCCEAVLSSLRLRYPQVYQSAVKLQLDIASINVRLRHFRTALSRIVPAGQRCRGSLGEQLLPEVRPLLSATLKNVLQLLAQSFPHGLTPNNCGHRRLVHSSVSYRPRLLLTGTKGQGHSSDLGPALIHAMERVPAHKLHLASLYSNASRTPEEAVTQVIHEACSRPPSIIYMPHIDQWFESTPESVRATFLTLLEDISPSTPVLLLATTTTPLADVDLRAAALFSAYRGEVFNMSNPTKEEREEFFKTLFYIHMVKHQKTTVRKRVLEALPVAQVAAPRELNEKELLRLVELEEATLRELRIFLRQICAKLSRNRQFFTFCEPVDVEEVPDYLNIIAEPMDLETMMSKVDRHEYTCAQDFLKDIELICHNALEYNPSYSADGKHIRHSACALLDTAYTLIKTEMDSDFEDKCQSIREARKKRKTKVTHLVPEFVYTEPPPVHVSSNGTSPQNGNSSSSGDKAAAIRTPRKFKRRSSYWARGCIVKPKKKVSLDSNNKAHDCKKEDTDAEVIHENDDFVRSVDSTCTLEISASEKCAMQLCNGELSGDENEAATSCTPVQSTTTSSTSAGPPPEHLPSASGVSSPALRRRSCSAAIPAGAAVPSSSGSASCSNPIAAAAQHEQDDLTVSSSERDEKGKPSEGVVDWSHLDAVYASCVSATADADVNQLRQLHTSILRLCRAYATTVDKAQLLLDTEAEIRNIFNVPASCLPSPKPAPRPAKVEDQLLRYFLQKDKITSFDAFKPERNLQKQYKNLIISRSKERLVCLFITGYFRECSLSVIVENKPTLCSPVMVSAFKNGISVPLFKTLHPNNGLRSYTQFDETVRLAMHYDIPFDKTIQNVVTLLQAHTSACVDTEKEKKLVFLTRQL